MTPYLLNLLDLALTLHAIHHGGVELNPLMQNPAVMVAWKVVGVGVLCGWLSRIARKDGLPHQRARWFAMTGLRAVTAVYAAVCIYHLYFIFGGVSYGDHCFRTGVFA